MSRGILILATISFLTFSCGGVIGNIEKYRFGNISPEKLKSALDRVYDRHPEFIKNDTTMYGMNDGNDFYFRVQRDGINYIFKCQVINYHDSNYNAVDLSLTTATEWGQIMHLAPKMGFFEKRKYRKLFEETILPNIRNEVLNTSKQKL